ncbi:protein kinase [Streptomyces sp. Qhu-G9]|uniref:protein kinase domain-containing protein n=1 Tax=Streptomyces sp. Qhu-G9 TaxID=3452799 RepID=UPI0022AC279C|nr:protein kinase [Streptomyces aurantiacus]WAU79650.1 protein kinase [Streptomyces aurantiacus]
MGRVWRAVDEVLDRQVAVKEMRIDGMDQEDARTRRERTLREARATARIDHPNVVRVYDVVDEGERLWIVMELVDGRSLERVVAEDGPLTARDTARIGLELVAALGQVHAGGVLHRDIKPGNVLVERRAGRVVLTDFGIAAIQNTEALTMAGMLVGSPDYMAPERVSGRPQGPPSDLWSLGATLCAALGGRSPFSRATTFATLHAVLYEEPEIPAAGELRDLLTTLLQKDPAGRPGLEELAEALGPVADGSTGTAAPAVPREETTAPAPAPAPARTATVTATEVPVPDDPGSGVPDTGTGPGAGRPEPGAEPDSRAASEPESEAPVPLRVEHPTTPFRRLPVLEPPLVTPPTHEGAHGSAEPVEDAVPLRATPATPEASAGPGGTDPTGPTGHAGFTHPDVENASSEAPPEGTPEIPSEGAAPGHVFHASGIRSKRPEPPEPTGSKGPTGSQGQAEAEPPKSPDPKPPDPQAERSPDPQAEVNSALPTRPRVAVPMPPGELPGPAAPSGSRGTGNGTRARNALVAAVGVLVAGVVAAVVLPGLGGSPDDKDRAAPSSSAAPSPSSSSSSSDEGGPAGPDPTVAGTARPAGSRTEAGMYAWVPPEGWERVVQSGAEVHYTSPDRMQEILANAAPARGNLMDQWEKTEKTTSKGLDYQRIRLEETTFRGAPAVVWEYTVTAKGLPWHARLLGFDTGGKSYEITTWYRPDIEDRALPVYEKVKDGFTPM